MKNPHIENTERLGLWIEALRSGNFPQTAGNLHDSEGFCCLGVLCEVALRNGVRLTTDTFVEDEGLTTIWKYNENSDFPPAEVNEWIGLQDNEDGEYFNSLASMNDTGKSFSAIADYLEGKAEVQNA
jgi:hypothetical protein